MSKPKTSDNPSDREDPLEKIERDRKELVALINGLIKRIEEETRKIQSISSKGSGK